MTAPTQGGTAHSMNDPVVKAVVDNIIGNLATKRSQVRCSDCDLDFTSQIVLDAHLQGARHAKQMRSKNILATLEETNVAFSKDQETNGLKCNVCNVYLNSIQQLQTHLNGNRHKKKMSKGDWTGKEIISRSKLSDMPSNCIPQPMPKNGLLSCNSCNKFFNSHSQLNVHLSSQKHSDKVNNIKSSKKKRYSPYWKKGGYATYA
ncbi:PREDICTED: zinc finger protein 346-like isoform X2 [Ceratosolen solmsi marchali]|uniref:Zinc finger protein 346-like isoform X2 n=1 Tax=Ceratosolen solmsi marchali TaxID=326594 RepID=A0AAJ7E352_9HYME|nr:PREDICTED: zinc finger protein 346-like isoform X2 [Ceratosolen solmsi marchali]